ncbi:type IV pilus inner membrane component PilO [Ferrimonas marina]|uniref:Type IV pilus assembly protein PilO n=1 Tax=Ferrimonas marina TaxID=299255 RepID=A0A1M5XHL9_9GAMM|nr:type 4a pilus biogenesis protein PilO [Ferrimonas marina]SHH99004.1 type IV pilus assembly protein PilO [Ferrimonas marina]
MNLNDINELEFENIGSWPKPAKIGFAVILAALLFTAGYFLLIKDSVAQLEQLQQKEVALKDEFQRKYQLAANLPRYLEELAEMQALFDQLVAMLPTEHEMSALLDSVTFLATDASLDIRSLNWLPEQQKEFYIEIPIEMELQGDYHHIGQFSAGVAGLSRIVSLHDFSIERGDGPLGMKVVAKTYRFAEQTEGESQ